MKSLSQVGVKFFVVLAVLTMVYLSLFTQSSIQGKVFQRSIADLYQPFLDNDNEQKQIMITVVDPDQPGFQIVYGHVNPKDLYLKKKNLNVDDFFNGVNFSKKISFQ